MAGQFHHQRLGHRARDLGKEHSREIRLVSVTQEGVPVKRVDLVEQLGIQVRTQTGVEGDSGFGDSTTFPPCLLALVGRECLKKGVEIRVAAIRPVKLAVASQEPAGTLAGLAVRFVHE